MAKQIISSHIMTSTQNNRVRVHLGGVGVLLSSFLPLVEVVELKKWYKLTRNSSKNK